MRNRLILAAIVFLLFVPGCKTVEVESERSYKIEQGPPDHAPAHGYRRKHSYIFYPSSRVYFDVDRKIYFYMEGGVWRNAPILPPFVKINKAKGVRIKSASKKPYIEIGEHLEKHPPGKGPKKKPPKPPKRKPRRKK